MSGDTKGAARVQQRRRDHLDVNASADKKYYASKQPNVLERQSRNNVRSMGDVTAAAPKRLNHLDVNASADAKYYASRPTGTPPVLRDRTPKVASANPPRAEKPARVKKGGPIGYASRRGLVQIADLDSLTAGIEEALDQLDQNIGLVTIEVSDNPADLFRRAKALLEIKVGQERISPDQLRDVRFARTPASRFVFDNQVPGLFDPPEAEPQAALSAPDDDTAFLAGAAVATDPAFEELLAPPETVQDASAAETSAVTAQEPFADPDDEGEDHGFFTPTSALSSPDSTETADDRDAFAETTDAAETEADVDAVEDVDFLAPPAAEAPEDAAADPEAEEDAVSQEAPEAPQPTSRKKRRGR